VNEGVFKHLTRAKFDEKMPRHIVRKISHHESSSPRFFDGATVDLQEVEVSVNIHLAVVIIQDASGREDLTVISSEMEQSLQLIDVRALLKLRRVDWNLEPFGHRDLVVTHETGVWFFINRHVNVESGRIEIEHYSLLSESETTKGSSNNLVDVVI